LNNIDALIEWLKVEQALTDALYFRGPWTEDGNNNDKYLVSLAGSGGIGGSGAGIHTRKQNIRIIMLGPVDGNTQIIEDIAAATVKRTINQDYRACGIAQIQVIGGIIGPGITTENRPWCEINFQLITN
jgi:hypothetical protein